MIKDDNLDRELKIAGFGACMISGYPHKAGGMLEVACHSIEKRLCRPVRSNIVSLGGFPAPRAEKHLRNKALNSSPDYLIIQFGSTDANCPIRRRSRPSSTSHNLSSSDPRAEFHHGQSATTLSVLRWELISLIGYTRKIDPITSMPQYVAAIMRMAKACRAAGVTPVVLSPFVYGSRYAMRNAIAYTSALRDLAKVQDMILIDCVRALQAQSKTSILQHDGFHLSLIGQDVVGRAIAESVVADVLAKSRAS
jgi:lysophospholipase L1-like esterase